MSGQPQRLFKTTAIIGSSTILTMLVGVIRAKIIAVVLGPEGTGLLGNVQVLLTLLETLASLGVSSAVLRFGREAETKGMRTNATDAVSTGVWLNGATSIVVVGLSALLIGQVSQATVGESGFELVLLVVILRVPLVLLYQTLVAVLNLRDEVKAIGAISVTSSVLTVTLTVPLVIWLGIAGGMLSLAANSLLIVLVALLYWYKLLRPDFPLIPRLRDRHLATRMVRYGAFSQSALILSAAGQYAIRMVVLGALGAWQLGLYSSSVGLAAYLGVFQSSLGVYYYPRVTDLIEDRDRLHAEVQKVFRFFCVLLTPLIVCVAALSDVVAVVFLSSEFTAIAGIVPWLLVAALVDLLWAVVGLPLFVLEKFRVYVGISFVFNLVMVCLVALGAHLGGTQGVAIGVLTAELVALLLYAAGARRTYGLKLSTENRALLFASLALTVSIAVLMPVEFVYRPLMLLAAIVWALVVVRRYEWSELRRLLAKVTGFRGSD